MGKIIGIALNEVMVNKLESIAVDIKYYMNANAEITQSLDPDSINTFMLMSDDEINELNEMRKKIKQLAARLKNRLPI